MEKFELDILGCGTATPSLRHLPSSQIVTFRDNLFMIDCAEGAQLQMRRMGLKFSRLNHIFISHLHGDHCLGLPGLLSTLALHQRTGEVVVHMFADGIRLFKPLVDFLARERTYDLRWEEVSPSGGIVFENKSLTVEAFRLYHRVPTVGYLFREKPKSRHLNGDMIRFHNIGIRDLAAIKEGADYVTPDGRVIANTLLTTPADPSMSYAYCSDTTFSAKVAEAVAGVDTLYHEATYASDQASKARERGHSTAAEAAEIAKAAGVKRLILGHFSKRYYNENQHLAEARAIFPNTVLANEGLTFDLNSPCSTTINE